MSPPSQKRNKPSLRTRLSRLSGKTELRLALVVLLVATLPLVVAVTLGNSLFSRAARLWFNAEVGEQLDRGVDVYKDYVKVVKDDLRHQSQSFARDPLLVTAVAHKDTTRSTARLAQLFETSVNLVDLRVEDENGAPLGTHSRGQGVDEKTERSLEVRTPVESTSATLVASFAVPRKRLDELEKAGAVVQKYHQLEASRSNLYGAYTQAFAALLGITMLVTVVLGALLARGVTRRINRLSVAIRRAGAGDLSVRVPVTGSDELTELARSFNQMVGEMGSARARIEFLQRMGAWQEMAQRLAHEIKNPLTPILLAVQECHRKYSGSEPTYKQLLETTREVVEEEVGTLRRLVGNFSRFARLPHAEPEASDLREFIADCADQLGHMDDAAVAGDGPDGEPLLLGNVVVEWETPDSAVPCAMDKQMMRRVVVNLVRNAVQACRGMESGARVRVRGSVRGSDACIEVEDSGPGIPKEALSRIFEPYFTTKTDGTGLGLAIVKKIVVEHNGTIEAGSSDLGGAKFTLCLPGAATEEAHAAFSRVSLTPGRVGT
ncbi:MAG: ATP-binding protein [Polyangiaceae bacterium]